MIKSKQLEENLGKYFFVEICTKNRRNKFSEIKLYSIGQNVYQIRVKYDQNFGKTEGMEIKYVKRFLVGIYVGEK